MIVDSLERRIDTVLNRLSTASPSSATSSVATKTTTKRRERVVSSSGGESSVTVGGGEEEGFSPSSRRRRTVLRFVQRRGGLYEGEEVQEEEEYREEEEEGGQEPPAYATPSRSRRRRAALTPASPRPPRRQRSAVSLLGGRLRRSFLRALGFGGGHRPVGGGGGKKASSLSDDADDSTAAGEDGGEEQQNPPSRDVSSRLLAQLLDTYEWDNDLGDGGGSPAPQLLNAQFPVGDERRRLRTSLMVVEDSNGGGGGEGGYEEDDEGLHFVAAAAGALASFTPPNSPRIPPTPPTREDNTPILLLDTPTFLLDVGKSTSPPLLPPSSTSPASWTRFPASSFRAPPVHLLRRTPEAITGQPMKRSPMAFGADEMRLFAVSPPLAPQLHAQFLRRVSPAAMVVVRRLPKARELPKRPLEDHVWIAALEYPAEEEEEAWYDLPDPAPRKKSSAKAPPKPKRWIFVSKNKDPHSQETDDEFIHQRPSSVVKRQITSGHDDHQGDKEVERPYAWIPPTSTHVYRPRGRDRDGEGHQQQQEQSQSSPPVVPAETSHPQTPQKIQKAPFSSESLQRLLHWPSSLLPTSSTASSPSSRRPPQKASVQRLGSPQMGGTTSTTSSRRNAPPPPPPLLSTHRLPSRSEPRLLPSLAVAPLEHLRSRVQETKYVTAVFEAATGGFGVLLDDVKTELAHWLGVGSRLLAVACEVHWSVPERFRSRILEIELKDCLHAALRDNNHRVLDLYDEWRAGAGGRLPFSVTHSKTEENCVRVHELDAFQGIYRRYYPELLTLQDSRTVASHSAYWAIDEGLGVREGNGRPDHYQSAADHYQAHYEQRLLVPQPAKFVEHAKRGLLGQLSVVAVNLAVLRLEGDHTVYGGPVQVNRELLGHFGNIAASAS